MSNNKIDHFQHVGSIRLNRVQYMESALGEHHNATELPKLRYLPDLPNPMRDVVLAALATSEQATNHFLASLAAHKRCEAKARLERHKAGCNKRRGKRGPNSRTITKHIEEAMTSHTLVAPDGEEQARMTSDMVAVQSLRAQGIGGRIVRGGAELAAVASEGHQKSVDAAKAWMNEHTKRETNNPNRGYDQFTSRMMETASESISKNGGDE